MTVAELIAVLSQYPDDMEVVLARFLSEDYDSVMLMLKDAEFDKTGAPTMRARFCCGVLKEYKVHDRAAQPLTYGLCGRKDIRAKRL